MSNFATAFWTPDYAAGLGVLFSKLQQGVQENEQILTVARMRAEAEDLYGQKLGDIEGATNRISDGFQRDDGATVKKAYEGVRTEMSEAARNHRKIASNIRELVVNPFGRWCEQHAARVQNSQDDLQTRIRSHDRQADTVRQYRSAYFNKCRRLEDLEEEDKLAFQDPNAAAATAAATGSPKAPAPPSVPSIKLVDDDDEPEPVEIGDRTYTPEQLKQILIHVLEHVRLGETKVPILGTYENVTTGAEIVEYIQKNMGSSSIAYAEKVGQDLIDNGLLRLIGNMGNTFANSSKMNYQWRTKVFQITGIPEKRPRLAGRTSTLAASDSNSMAQSPVIGDRVSEMWSSNWNPLNNQHPNETPAEKLRREAKEADDRYKAAVRRLDSLRCNLEEEIIGHMKYMERCELDRLKAIKSVILDFSGAISNVIPSLQSGVDKMMLFQETVQPLADSRYLLENYRTGNFHPRVVIYENYYNRVDEQTFGVDIEARARADKKRVPLIITTILTFLDSHYPDLEGDEARRGIWVAEVPLSQTHHLRNRINTGKAIPMDVLEEYDMATVAAVLKLYLLELPDSLVSSHVYEVVKTTYTSTQSSSDQARVQVLQTTLGQLRLANIATLDALVTHFTRLIDLTSADEAYVSILATTLAPCVMRPKQESGLSMAEKYNVRLVRDLFTHKDAIFGELKRQSSLTHSASGARNRAVSTDESKRKEAMEERQRAIAAAQHAQTTGTSTRSRQPSPGSSTRIPLTEGSMHRRDRSRGPETRFPISTASVTSPASSTASNRDSLNVPGSPPSTRQVSGGTTTTPPKPQDALRTNGSIHQPPPTESEQSTTASDTTARGRSATDATSKRIDTQSAAPGTSSAPGDTYSPGHSYSQSVGSSLSAGTGVRSASATSSEVQKKDSLGRGRTPYKPKSSGMLQTPSGDTTPTPQTPAGVQLQDRPMDFD